MNFATLWGALCRQCGPCCAGLALLACMSAPLCAQKPEPAVVQNSSTAPPGQLERDVANDSEAVVLSGKIANISPSRLTAGAPLMITVNVSLARPITATALERNLRVFIDSVPLASTVIDPAPPGPIASSMAAAAEAAAPSAVIHRSVTLMVTAPKSLARDGTFTLSVYSTLDRREVAATEV